MLFSIYVPSFLLFSQQTRMFRKKRNSSLPPTILLFRIRASTSRGATRRISDSMEMERTERAENECMSVCLRHQKLMPSERRYISTDSEWEPSMIEVAPSCDRDRADTMPIGSISGWDTEKKDFVALSPGESGASPGKFSPKIPIQKI